jgi:hypothetical protein
MACWSGSSLAGCISIQVTVTPSVMSGNLSLQSSHSMLVYCWWIRGVGNGYVQDYNIIICNCLTLTLTWVNIMLVYAYFSL